MIEAPVGIAIPIEFRTNKIRKAVTRYDEALDRTAQVRASRPVNGSMELYFAPRAVQPEDIDLVEPGRTWHKERALYNKHNVHGEHHFLVPVNVERIEADRYIWNTKDRYAFGMVNGSPTTATATETLQLFPCDKFNLQLFLERLQSNPFYIEVRGEDFAMVIKDKAGKYRRILSQVHCPTCWHGSRHPVVTLQGKHTYKPITRLEDIPWAALSELGTAI